MNGHKVVINAILDEGDSITERELRLILEDLEKRGFYGTYDRVPQNFIKRIFGRFKVVIPNGE